MSTARILVVDDEDDMRDVLADVLRMHGYTVTTAADGHTALEQAQRRRFDLVITDLRMPGMDGVETMAALKSLYPTIRVIVATGLANVSVESLRRQGACDVLHKPFGVDEFLHATAAALGDYSS